jgi:hypothetical protein
MAITRLEYDVDEQVLRDCLKRMLGPEINGFGVAMWSISVSLAASWVS